MRAALLSAALIAGALPVAGTAQAEDMPKPICTDRPTKGNNPCTVDEGRWQVETDLADFTHDRSGGVTTDSALFASATVKYGVTPRLDLQLTVTPYQYQAVQGQPRMQGFGDLVAKAKIVLVPGENGVSLLPFVKLPTAGGGLGNGAVEGGMIAPIAVVLPAMTTLNLNPEIDVLKTDGKSGRHLAYALAASLTRPLSQTFTGSVELWAAKDQDADGRAFQSSFDLALTWIPPKDQDLQLDGGVNLGLNRDTPQVNLYVGVSRRF